MSGWNWRRIWFWLLLSVFVLWLVVELASIAADRGYVTYTLSDTIRDWETQYPWLRWVVLVAFAGLWLHFFIQKNRPRPDG